jgi:hypothetical protein
LWATQKVALSRMRIVLVGMMGHQLLVLQAI